MAHIVGNQSDNTLVGTSQGDLIQGGAGNDVLFGLGANDTLEGGPGADALYGGTGEFDFADYSKSTAVLVDLGTNSAAGGHAFGDSLVSIECLIGSNEGDFLTGNGKSNILLGQLGKDLMRGSGGNDRLVGGGQDDILEGGQGDDILEGNSGADRMDGGNGSDDVDYSASATGVSVNLETGRGTFGDAEGDRYAGIEAVVATRHADLLIGSPGDDRLFGGTGGDRIEGRGGNDVLFAFQFGPIGLPTLSGGAGDDEVSGSGLPNGNSGNNRLEGDALGDIVVTDDVLNGGIGDDILVGSLGAETNSGGAGLDVFDYDAEVYSSVAEGQDLITDFAIGQDRFDLATIDAIDSTPGSNESFTFIGISGFTGVEGQLRFAISSNRLFSFVQTDSNGDRIADLQLVMNGGLALTAADFVL